MSELRAERKTILELFSGRKSNFLIPDYQRPYAWGEAECETLWEDIVSFAVPDNNITLFDVNDEYFLGPIVTFINDQKQVEIIDGQQRLTTVMLMLRYFYEGFKNMQDDDSVTTRKTIEKCIWQTDEFDKPNFDAPKIDSKVAADDDNREFLTILKTGKILEKSKSKYAENYRYFKKKTDNFIAEYPSYFPLLVMRILKNCVLLPIEADKQDTALQIFSTLNNRGKPLSDADIFKSEFYKYYCHKGERDKFISRWKNLEKRCERIFNPSTGTPMDELFTRYMYYERAKSGNKNTSTEALRKFYEKNGYALLKKDETLDNLEQLTTFWMAVNAQDDNVFSERVLRLLFVLNYAPNGMWTYFVSVYFMHNKDDEGKLDDDKFYKLLNKLIAFIWAYAISNPGVNALRTPLFTEMLNIIDNKPVEFLDFKFDIPTLTSMFNNYTFSNVRPITKSMLAWWSFQYADQETPDIDTPLEIEHIYAKKRHDTEPLSNDKYLELLGNKSLLEKKINIRAADYRFCDKKQYYIGYTNSRNQRKDGTKIQELISMATTRTDFQEPDILVRNAQIINGFMEYLKSNALAK